MPNEILVAYMIFYPYSMICSPDMFFKITKYRDSPEYAAAYFAFFIFFSMTLIPIFFRVLCPDAYEKN